MAFGQATGPPADPRRVAELAALLAEQGYDSFREARRPFGLTQRQAAGRFTTAEVDELIDALQAGGGDEAAATDTTSAPVDARRRAREEELVVTLDAEVMATELVNRGWCCIAPPGDAAAS